MTSQKEMSGTSYLCATPDLADQPVQNAPFGRKCGHDYLHVWRDPGREPVEFVSAITGTELVKRVEQQDGHAWEVSALDLRKRVGRRGGGGGHRVLRTQIKASVRQEWVRKNGER